MTDFESTLDALERDLTVGLIATNPVFSCDVDDVADEVFGSMAINEFSQAIVKSGNSTVGVLRLRAGCASGRVGDVMEPLHDWMLVAKGSSLRKSIKALAREDRRFRLVVGDDSIEGIVTRSDLHKLPVRLLVFTLVTHLESLLTAHIRSAYPSDHQWLEILASSEIPRGIPSHAYQALMGAFGREVPERIRNRAAANRKRDAEPDLLYMVDFREKWFLVHVAYSPGETFVSDMAAIQLFVRNAVVHARDYAQDDQAVDDFERRIVMIETWIRYFSRTRVPNGQHT